MLCFAMVSGDFIKLLFLCQLGKSWQDLASCDHLLVVKLVVKGEGLLLRILNNIAFRHFFNLQPTTKILFSKLQINNLH